MNNIQKIKTLPCNTVYSRNISHRRKQRVVKNADVDTNVLDPPGYNYINWITITKRKLKVCIR